MLPEWLTENHPLISPFFGSEQAAEKQA